MGVGRPARSIDCIERTHRNLTIYPLLQARSRRHGAELTFDPAPLLAKIVAHEDIRFQIAERNRQRRQNQPPQTIKDDPVPLSISEPEPLEATGSIKARFVIERLQGNVNDGKITINDALGWLIHNAADVDKKP